MIPSNPPRRPTSSSLVSLTLSSLNTSVDGQFTASAMIRWCLSYIDQKVCLLLVSNYLYHHSSFFHVVSFLHVVEESISFLVLYLGEESPDASAVFRGKIFVLFHHSSWCPLDIVYLVSIPLNKATVLNTAPQVSPSQCRTQAH